MVLPTATVRPLQSPERTGPRLFGTPPRHKRLRAFYPTATLTVPAWIVGSGTVSPRRCRPSM